MMEVGVQWVVATDKICCGEGLTLKMSASKSFFTVHQHLSVIDTIHCFTLPTQVTLVLTGAIISLL